MRMSIHGRFEHPGQHAFGREDIFSQLARGAAVPLVVGVDAPHAGGSFVQTAEGHHSFTHREPVAQTGVLDQHRPTGGEVTNAPVAEPAAAHFDVTILRHADLRAGILDEGAVRSRWSRNNFPRRDFPAVAYQQLRFDAHLREAKFLRRQSRQAQEAGKFLVALPIGSAVVSRFAETLPAHDGGEMRSVCSRERPFRQKNRRQGFQPRAGGGRNRAVRGAEALSESETSLAPDDALEQSLVAIGNADLGKTGVHVQENAPARPVIFLSPDPEWHGTHCQQVGVRAERQKSFQRRAQGAAVRAINPVLLEAERLQAFADVSGRIGEIEGPFRFLPIVNPGTIAAVFELKNLVPEGAETEQVLEAGPGLSAQAGATDRACENALHTNRASLVICHLLFGLYNPALFIRLPTTFSAAKYSTAISRAARQLPS